MSTDYVTVTVSARVDTAPAQVPGRVWAGTTRILNGTDHDKPSLASETLQVQYVPSSSFPCPVPRYLGKGAEESEKLSVTIQNVC